MGMSTENLPLSAKEISSVVDSVSNVWGVSAEREALRALQTVIDSRYKQEIRWHWHLLTTTFFLVGMILIQNGAAIGIGILLAWPSSALLHASYAQNKAALAARRANELFEKTSPTILRHLEDKKKSLVQGAPFDRSGPSRDFGIQTDNPSAAEAETLCAKWMALLGEENVEVTRSTSDGGIDITSNRCVAQVKNYKGSVGVAEVRSFFGAAVVDGRLPLFFTSGTYTKSALDFADSAGIYLYRYVANEGTLDGVNELAKQTLYKSSI